MDNSTPMAGPRRQRRQRMASEESYHDEIPVPVPGQGSNKPSAISTHSLERYSTATPQKQRFSWLFIVIMGLSTIVTASLLAMRLFTLPASAAPQAIEVEVDVAAPAASVSTAAPAYPAPASPESAAPKAPAYSAAAAAGSWWMSDIKRQGVVAYGSANYKIFRNVKDYGAKGDGSSDDTEAINAAFSDGNRCGKGCDSSTTTPAIVYFPAGTYVVSKPILPYYYTHMIGDVNNLPVLKPTANFEGMAVIDVDPYNSDGSNWHTNQNNFFRQVRNFKIDLTGMPKSSGTGIHWQVAQATSLQNIVFQMIEDPSDDNKQQGIFIDNGSGGFMTDLTFIGGRYGGFFGSQQFTSRNMTFRNCNTAVYMNWNWLWTLNGLDISGAKVGIDMTAGGNVQNVGSILLTDSKIANTAVGVLTNYNPAQPDTNGTLIIDNVDMSSAVPVAVKGGGSSATILAGNAKIASWVQGRAYSGGSGKAIQATQTPVTKPKALLDSKGNVVTKSKPQYNSVPASNFISVKSKGAKGDGKTDDTAAIQAVFNSVQDGQIVYFDHGAYVITDTVKVPKNIKIVGEIWPLIMAGGNKNFKDQANPKPVWQVGQAGDVGNVEIQDLMFETLGPQPGAILMEFNVAGTAPGSAGLFDVHFRVGGSAGTQLQSDKCKKNPKVKAGPNPECLGAFMLFHMTKQSSCYLENTWFWVADHELDLGDHSQINLYNGRGVLIESTKGAWLWGTASEHSVLYNYHLEDASNVYMSLIQTETAYMQGNPDATVPFTVNKKYFDPDFKATCTGTSQRCARTWGLRAVNSKDVFIYGGGLYSFFDNYDQVCVGENNCQDNMIDIESSQVHLYGISTKASVNMVNVNGKSAILDKDNRNNFCAAIAFFSS